MKKLITILIILIFFSLGNCDCMDMTKYHFRFKDFSCFATINCYQGKMVINVSDLIAMKIYQVFGSRWISFLMFNNQLIRCFGCSEKDLNNFLKEVKQCQEKYLK